ncbi:WD40 repeat domain-containing serine/threonine protein kinase [Streptomyces odontomachi]|uniref:WD40 repeat domain-containing serine/threonine protein kinase n=1 Tax=Streptomyces odontomachi TaxID=2944940 RepID=UPI002108BA9E|nr:serine/threonine-protein kinase [Streptomyces sp. ODS25]
MRAGELIAGRYRLGVRLGHGGMGEVWKGFDTELERPVALKVLLEFHAAEEPLRRFRREASIGARLQHPGFTVVHDIGRHDGRMFLVMELLEGEDLAELLARSPDGLPVPEALDLGVQMAEALAVAHAGSVVHRDLKPANLFLLTDGRLKICDFGIARTAEATEGLTVTGRPFGSPPYMAPEQWRGEHVDARCDLYALGCVLYALLTGDPPFPSTGQPWALMLRHLEEIPPGLRSVRAEVPVGVAELVAGLLAKDPADRPDAATVARCLRALRDRPAEADDGSTAPADAPVTGTPATGTPATGTPATGTPATDDPSATAPTTNAPTTNGPASEPTVTAHPSPKEAPRPPAPSESSESSGSSEPPGPPEPPEPPGPAESASRGPRRRGVILGGLAGVLAVASGGTYLALELTDGANGAATRGQHWFTLGGFRGYVNTLAFSPDGRTLATGSGDRAVRLWHIDSRRSTTAFRTFTHHTKDVEAVAFSADGKSLASGGLDDFIQVWDPAKWPESGGRLPAHGGATYALAFSPDSTTLATGHQDGAVQLWHPASEPSSADVITAHQRSVLSVAFSPDGKVVASAGADGTVRLWNATKLRVIATLSSTGGDATTGMYTVAFRPHGAMVAGVDGAVELWDADAPHKRVATLSSDHFTVNTLAFSPDGRTLATGHQDGSLRLWYVSGRQLTATLTGHKGFVNAVAFSPDGKVLASGSTDNTVRLWQVS